jgi:hypothetical protein
MNLFIIKKPFVNFNKTKFHDLEIEVFECNYDKNVSYLYCNVIMIHKYINNKYWKISLSKHKNFAFGTNEVLNDICTTTSLYLPKIYSFTTLELAKISKLMLLDDIRINFIDELESRQPFTNNFPNIYKQLEEMKSEYPEYFI